MYFGKESTKCGGNLSNPETDDLKKKLCPINSNGCIEGINNLLVIDQSTLPTCPTINPQATSTLMALINTKRFIKKLK